jgi:hypothetical protein
MDIKWVELGVQCLVLLVAVTAHMWRFGQAQEKRLMLHLDTKFDSEYKQRRISDANIEALLEQIKMDGAENEKELRRVQRELLELKADLPRVYVFRDDYVRGQTVLESKLDALALRIENQQLRGDRHA